MKNLAYLGLVCSVALSLPATAQNWDNSGNGSLKGSYYFREVAWIVGDNAGNLNEAISIYGGINFDGNGNFTLSGAQVFDSSNGKQQAYQFNGTYSISASGYGFLSSPISQGESVYGLVANGVFIGSSTDNKGGFNDLLIAAPIASPQPTNSFFNGKYTMAGVDFPSGSAVDTRQSTFQLNADGNGNLGSVSLTGYIAGRGTSVINQNISRVSYRFSNGAAVVSFGGSLSSSNLIAGDKYLYFSPDGNFVFGGSPTAWDMIVGVRGGGSAPNFSGLYYAAGVDQDNSQLGSGGGVDLNTYYGALNATGSNILGHQRLLSPFNKGAVDYTYGDSYTANADGTIDEPLYHYVFGQGGQFGAGITRSQSGLMGVVALLRAPSFSGSGGPYIFPTGILNAGSSAPFTASLVPGELISIYGTNFTSVTQLDGSLPTTLAGVQVMVNGQLAPIYSIAHTSSYDQINAIVPLGTTQTIAAVQVFDKNGTGSNTVTNFTGLTQPGAFPENIGGTIFAAAQHADYSQVTPSAPAQVGETLQIYLTGLGTLNSSGNANSTITAYIDGVQAPVSYAGTQSQVGGGYQVNVQVPSGIHSGNVLLDISGPDAYNSEWAIPIAAGSGTRAVVTSAARRGRNAISAQPHVRRWSARSLRRP